MNIVVVLQVEVERDEGKFASREELEEKILDEVSSADPSILSTDDDATYSVTSWEAESYDPKDWDYIIRDQGAVGQEGSRSRTPRGEAMTVDLEWGDPPAPREPGYNVDWTAVVAELEDHPGEWAKVIETPVAKRAHDLCRNLKDGRYSAVDPTRFEIVARSINGGRGGVWMRCLTTS
jgi:hypothetical protein